MLVKVTKDHIRQGQRCHSTRCPLALALQNATGSVWEVGSNGEAHDGQGRVIYLSPNLAQWIVAFDEGLAVKPIQFQLQE